MRNTKWKAALGAVAALLVLAACGGGGGDGDKEKTSKWFVQADFDKQDEQRSATFEGSEDEPWLQYIDGEMTDTADFKVDGPQKVCFANASISNPWRQTGWITMNEQLKDAAGTRCHLRDGDARRRRRRQHPDRRHRLLHQ